MTTKADWETMPGPLSRQQPKVVNMGSSSSRGQFGKHACPGWSERYPGSFGANRPSDERITRLATLKNDGKRRAPSGIAMTLFKMQIAGPGPIIFLFTRGD